MEANVDDMNPEIFEQVMEKLFQKGALDVFFTPIIMKKSRPAVKITCLSPQDKKDILSETMLKETSTLGIRMWQADRVKLYREIKQLDTSLGRLKVKVSKMGDEVVRITPEYEDLKYLAAKNNIPLIKAYEIVRGYFLKNN